MTGIFLLDWIELSLSLFNTILLLWLGLTVLLNAERRVWGMWLAAAGLLTGGLFFAIHTVLLGHLYSAFILASLDFWWRSCLLVVVLLPFAWYVVILWYSGCWDERHSSLWKRQRFGFGLVGALVIVLGSLPFQSSFPSVGQIIAGGAGGGISFAGVPGLFFLYPPYTLTCIGLALDALRRPLPSERMLGDLARRRARPWMTGASLILLVVGLLVGAIVLRLLTLANQGALRLGEPDTIRMLAWFDLAVEGSIAVAVVFIGQAVTVYEVFTGKSLPRQGLSRLWKRTLILAGGFSLVVSASLDFHLNPVYILLLAALILVAFLALLGWRQFAERETLFQHIRPFVANQRIYESVILQDAGAVSGSQAMFSTLCEQVLGVQKALLIPLGTMLPLIGTPVSYPPGEPPGETPGWTAEISRNAPQYALYGGPMLADAPGGYLWWLPLWREKALAGILILGDKQDGGLFTREEMEIARSAGEQVLDMLASAELARRLVHLQRQQIAESQVYDRQLRRALHDDILPQIHEAILDMDRLETTTASEKEHVLNDLIAIHRQISGLLRGLKTQRAYELNRIGLEEAVRQVVEGELDGAFNRVEWIVDPDVEKALKDLSPVEEEVLYYAAREAVRNAAAHACEGPDELPDLKIAIQRQNGLKITVEDDGGRLLKEKPAGANGSGQGLSLHSTMMSIIGGTLRIETVEGQYTRVILELHTSA